MPGLIAFTNGIVGLVATGVGAFSAGSLTYGAFHWFQGNHERARSGVVGAIIGSAIILCAAVLGTGIAALPHG